MLHIKKDDQVMVISGKDKGKTGKVICVFPDRRRVVVENINVVKKAKKKTQQDPTGGFSEIEAPIHLAKVMLVDKKTNKPARFGVSILEDGSKIRISRKTQEAI